MAVNESGGSEIRSRAGEAVTPRRYPLLAVLVIVATSAATTWLLPAEQGYIIAAGTIALVLAYGVIATSVRLTTDPVFLAVFGGYWVGLVVHYYHSPHPELLRYIFSTPVAVLATVVVLPQFIAARPETFTAGVTTVATLIALFGLGLVALEQTTTLALPQWVGQPVMGYGAYRTASVYQNPNTYGIVMMVGTLTAAYTYLSRRGVVWLGALTLCLVGFILAEGDAGFVGFVAGAPLVVSARDRRLGLATAGALVGATYLAIQSGHVQDVMQTTFLGRVYRWVDALEALAANPLWGIGFGEDGMRAYRVHNSYLHVPLGTGLIAGGLYVASLWYALARGLRACWTPWTGYVVGTGAAVLAALWFETATLGGVNVTSVLLGLYVGLLLELHRGSASEVSAAGLRRSRIGRVWDRIRS